MKIINVENRDNLVDIEEIELSYFGLTGLAGTVVKIQDLRHLLNINWKGELTLKLEENESLNLIKSERAFKLIIDTVYSNYKHVPDMLVRFE